MKLKRRLPLRVVVHLPIICGIDPSEGVRECVGEFRLADSPESVDPRDHAGVFVGQLTAEFEEFIQAAGEFLVVGGDFVLALRGLWDLH